MGKLLSKLLLPNKANPMSSNKTVKMIASVALVVCGVVLSSCATSSVPVSQSSSRLTLSDSMLNIKPGVPSNSFITPQAPSRDAKPKISIGKDKHGVPLYHAAQRHRVVRTTAYTHSESDHLSYGAKNAIGTSLKYTSTVRSAAADWSVYPLGTKFKVKGQPYTYVVDDYGSALVGSGTIDIYQPTKKLMRDWGRRYVEIVVVQWGNPEQSMRVLSGRKGYSHCGRMYAALKRQQGNVAYVQGN